MLDSPRPNLSVDVDVVNVVLAFIRSYIFTTINLFFLPWLLPKCWIRNLKNKLIPKIINYHIRIQDISIHFFMCFSILLFFSPSPFAAMLEIMTLLLHWIGHQKGHEQLWKTKRLIFKPQEVEKWFLDQTKRFFFNCDVNKSRLKIETRAWIKRTTKNFISRKKHCID